MKTRVLLVDDHSIVRLGIRTIVEKMDGLDIIGEALDGKEAFEFIEKQKPDIVLLDISLPKMNGIDVAKKVRETNSDIKILILSIYDKEEYVMKSVEYCNGYVMKNANPEEIKLAIETVLGGNSYYGASISQIMMNSMVAKKKSGTVVSKHKLTPREIEIIRLIKQGFLTKEIAEKLFVSVRTVESHRTNIYHKLDIRNSAQLIGFAIKNNL